MALFDSKSTNYLRKQATSPRKKAPTTQSRDPSSGVSVEMLLSKLLASGETHTAQKCAMKSGLSSAEESGAYCCYNLSVWFLVGFPTGQNIRKPPNQSEIGCQNLPILRTTRLFCDGHKPNKPNGAADRQVITIGVVELNEVLTIAKDAVARWLLAASRCQFQKMTGLTHRKKKYH